MVILRFKGIIVSYLKGLCLLCAWFFSIPLWADLQAVGLMNGMAIVELNGQRLVLREGQEKSGVKLLQSDNREAKVMYQGREQRLQLGVSVTSSYKAPQKEEVRLSRSDNGHYLAKIKVNGHWIESLVDTGATTISINSNMAKRMGLNYASGRRARSSTAAGIVNVFVLSGNVVQLGGITRYNVPVTVHEGDFPSIALLGMSFLNQVSMREENGMLILTD